MKRLISVLLLIAAIIAISQVATNLYSEESYAEKIEKEADLRKEKYQDDARSIKNKRVIINRELNDAITESNRHPSSVILREVSDLRAELVENMEKETKNDASYIKYLERTLDKVLTRVEE